jgi:hypothetical protein
MDQTGDTTPPPALLVLGDEDAAVCADGFCELPAPQTGEPTGEVPDAG